MSVSKRMAEVISESQLTSPKLGKILGTSHSTIDNIKRGKDLNTRVGTVVEFLKYFNKISPDWLLLGKGAKTRDEAYGVLIEQGITKPLDPDVRDMILGLVDLNQGLSKQILIQQNMLDKFLKAERMNETTT